MAGVMCGQDFGGTAGSGGDLSQRLLRLDLPGHGTDKALLAGILGFARDDVRIQDSLSLAEEAGLHYEFHCEDLPGALPNTARITLTGSGSKEVTVQRASVGDGNILVSEINGMAVHVTG